MTKSRSKKGTKPTFQESLAQVENEKEGRLAHRLEDLKRTIKRLEAEKKALMQENASLCIGCQQAAGKWNRPHNRHHRTDKNTRTQSTSTHGPRRKQDDSPSHVPDDMSLSHNPLNTDVSYTSEGFYYPQPLLYPPQYIQPQPSMNQPEADFQQCPPTQHLHGRLLLAPYYDANVAYYAFPAVGFSGHDQEAMAACWLDGEARESTQYETTHSFEDTHY